MKWYIKTSNTILFSIQESRLLYLESMHFLNLKSKYADKHGENIVIQRNQHILFLSFVLYGEFMVFNATFNNISVIQGFLYENNYR